MTGAELIAAERNRQVEQCGWTADHDDAQREGEILECAVKVADDVHSGSDTPLNVVDSFWPYARADKVIKKYGKDYVRRLAVAGALIAAEIDRLQRLDGAAADGEDDSA